MDEERLAEIRAREQASAWSARWKAIATRYRAMLAVHRDRDIPRIAALTAEREALAVENRALRTAIEESVPDADRCDHLDAYAAHLDREPIDTRERRCAECRRVFAPNRSWQRYCDAVCARLGGVKRVRAQRAAARYTGGCS